MLDHKHVPIVTDRTAPQREARERLVAVAIVGRQRSSLRRRRAEELPATGERVFPVAVAEQAEIANAVEAGRTIRWLSMAGRVSRTASEIRKPAA